MIWAHAKQCFILEKISAKNRKDHLPEDSQPRHPALHEYFKEYQRSVIDYLNNGIAEDLIADIVNRIRIIRAIPTGRDLTIGTTREPVQPFACINTDCGWSTAWATR